MTTSPPPSSLPPPSAVPSDHRLGHKRRQRARNRELKILAFHELLDRLPPFHELPLAVDDDDSLNDGNENTDEDISKRTKKKLSDLYRPIRRPDVVVANEFWAKVPPICNPNKAVLEANISDERELSVDRYNSEKYRRKLQYKKEKGDITQTELEELWGKHGKRTTNTNSTDTTAKKATATSQIQTQTQHTSSTTFGTADAVSLLSNDRGQRKAWQVENFVSILWERLSSYTSDENNDNNEFAFTVVDFGCGSGNLCLALAPYFSQVRFVMVDMKSYSLKLVERRANEAGLKNVQVLQFSFSPSNLDDFCIPPISPAMNTNTWFMPPPASTTKPSSSSEGETSTIQQEPSSPSTDFDIAIGLHCCGSFTDMVMSLAKSRGADCIVCPCCNGAMTSKTTCGYNYPRSSYVKKFMNQDEYLSMSKAAEDSGIYEAKCLIEYDRALWADENGYNVQLLKMSPEDCTPKHHVLYLTNKKVEDERG